MDKVDYYRAPFRAQGATLQMQECIMVPRFYSPYQVSDGSAVRQGDTFMGQLGWTVQSGNISIYTTSGSNGQ